MKIIKTPTISDCIVTASKIASNYNSLNAKKCYVFCVDKIALSLELEIAKLCGGGFFNIDVSTFTRYISTLNKNVKALSKESSVMAVRKIILDKQNYLKCFAKSKYSPNLAVTVYELISQLSSAKVTPTDLSEVLNYENKLGKALTSKLQDIKFIFEEYRNYLNANGYIDRNDYLELMPSLVRNDENLKGATVILVGFSSVTRQRAEIFKALNEVAGEIYGVVLASEDSEIYTNETYEKLLDIDRFAEVQKVEFNYLPEIDLLIKHLFDPNVFKSSFKKTPTKNITVTEYPSVETEIESVAKEIVKEVKINGNRYKNIAVMVGGLDNYKLTISKIFREYNIPYYVDKAESLSNHPICRFVLDLIDLTRKNLAVKEVVKFVSNGMFLTNKTISDKFNNYVKKFAITRNGIKQPFKYEDDNLVELENVRKAVVEIYSKINSAKTVNEIISAIKYAFEYALVNENVNYYNEKLNYYGETVYAEFNDKIIEKVYSLLDEIAVVLGNGQISLLNFKSIFLSGASSTTIGAIPLFNDAVYVGECKDVKIKRVDILYAVGISGNIPFAKSDSALLSDGDLASLDEFKIIVEPKIKIVNKREKENVCLAFMSFNKKLNVSYSSVDCSGKGAIKSEIITYLTKIFDLPINSERKKYSDINEKLNKGLGYNDDVVNEYVSDKYLSKSSTCRQIARVKQLLKKRKASVELASFNDAISSLDENFNASIDKILNYKDVKPDTISNANGCLKGEEISATTLEEYFACPYSNFVKNSLRLKSAETGEIQYNEIGTMLHSLVEEYAKRINEVSDKQSSDSLVESIITDIYNKEEYAKYVELPSYNYVFSKLKNEGKKACYDVYLSVENSDFKPKYFELRFGEKEKIKGIKLNAKSGNYKVKGAIDRVDVAGNKLRIIDYKSGKTHPETEAFYTGNNLQLYLYMNAFSREEFEPSGAYYFPIKDDYVDENKAQKQILEGNTVNDAEVIKATDKNLDVGGSSSIVKVTLNKDGAPYANRSKVLTKSQMDAYLEYAVMIASKGVDEINSGYVKASPYNAKNKCSYCEYGGLCGKNLKEEDGRKIGSVKPDEVVEAVKREKEFLSGNVDIKEIK